MANFLKDSKAVIGMIHVQALPGTPDHHMSIEEIVTRAREEARLYQEAGIDMLAIENMHDVPYLNREVGPEIVAAMTAVGREVKNSTGLPVGVQILAGANKAALAVALAAGLDFIRVEGFCFAHVADEGLIQADAAELLRYRRNIGATRVAVLADIKKKHAAHMLTSDVSVEDTARAVAFFRGDGIILTGNATGEEADLDELKRVKQAVDVPLLVGSGISASNVDRYLEVADALIVGSYFKEEGHWRGAVDVRRVQELMGRVFQWRK